MNDTSPEITKKMHEMLRTIPPVRRLEMGWSMYLTSRTLVINAILRKNPNITKLDLKKELFLKFYGDEFSQEYIDKFFRFLESQKTD